MMAMIISMFIGMNIGLTSGIFLGIIFQGNLYYSTLLAMGIGALSGSICCFKMGITSSLEGFMAGVMGGMMGAMLGEMLEPVQSLVFLNIFLTLSICSIFLFKIFPTSGSSLISSADMIKAMFVFLFISAYLIAGSHLGKEWVNNLPGISGNDQDQKELHHDH
jgi:hypothetical protein